MNKLTIHFKTTATTVVAVISVICSFAVIGCSMLLKTDSSLLNPNSSSTVSFSNSSSNSDQSHNQSQALSSEDENSSSNESETSSNTTSSTDTTSSNTQSNNSSSTENETVSKRNFSTAMWFSFYDLNFSSMDYDTFKGTVDEMFSNAKQMGVTDLYIHTRPFADAYYRSELFPFSAYVSGIQGVDPGYDPLKYMVSASHSKGMKIHAWLNPYRVANSTDLTLLANTNIAKIWLTDNNTENDRYVLEFEGKLYFNPTVPQVQKLVIDGVREILDNYDVDGIHLDDYFYPTTDEGFDKPEYDAYVALSSNPLSHDDWRRNNVNALVSGIYSAVHSGYDAVFGISPSAHISTDKTDTNYNEAYADIGLWMNSTGYIDYIAPQLYFGYNYPLDKMKFNNLLEVWCKMPRKSNIKMYIGIAAYKIGNSDAHSNEWIDETDILGRQTIDSYNAECDGIAIYSYSSLFNEPSELAQKQYDSLISALETLR